MALMARFASSVPFGVGDAGPIVFQPCTRLRRPWQKAARTRRRNRSRSVLFIFEAGDFPLISPNDYIRLSFSIFYLYYFPSSSSELVSILLA